MTRRIYEVAAFATFISCLADCPVRTSAQEPLEGRTVKGSGLFVVAPPTPYDPVRRPELLANTPASAWDNSRRPRAVKPPVDLSDAKACYRELAELASFGFLFNRLHDFRGNAVGSAFGARLDTETLDRLVRFEHLSHSADPQFRDLVEEVRGIWLDAWRLNRAFYMGYSDGGRWKSPLEDGEIALKPFYALLAAVKSTAAKDAARATARSVNRPTGHGGFVTGTQVGPTYVDNGVYQAEVDRLLKEKSASVAPAISAGADRFRAILNSVLAQERKALAIRQCLELTRRRMGRLWNDRVMPRLIEYAGPEAKAPLAAFGPHEAFGMPAEGKPGSEKVSIHTFGSLVIRNNARRALHHVTARITLKQADGDEAMWYAYMPLLDRSQCVLPIYAGMVCRPSGRNIIIRETGAPIEATLSLYCDEGRDVGRELDVALGEPDVKAKLFNEGLGLLAEMVTGQTNYEKEAAERFGNSPVVPRSAEDVIAEAKVRLRAYRFGTRKIEPLPPGATLPSGEEQALLTELRAAYPAPRNPETARRELAAAIQPGRTYVSQNPGKANDDFSLEFEPLNAQSKTITGRITRSVPKGQSRTDTFVGRFVEEVPRGCVIALIDADTQPLPERKEEMAKKAAKAPKKPEPTREEVRLKSLEHAYEQAQKQAAREQNPSIKAKAEMQIRRLENQIKMEKKIQEARAAYKPKREALDERAKKVFRDARQEHIRHFLEPDSPVLTDRGEIFCYRRIMASRDLSGAAPRVSEMQPQYVVFVDNENHLCLQTQNGTGPTAQFDMLFHKLELK
jgi:hypothetical protein